MQRIKVGKAATFIFSLILFLIALQLSGAKNAFYEMQKFPINTLLLILTLSAANFVVVSFRLSRLLSNFGVGIRFRDCLTANVYGYLGGFFIISLFGQFLGRQTILQRYGVPPVLGGTLMIYEKIAIFIVSVSACILGVEELGGIFDIPKFIADARIGAMVSSVCLGGLLFAGIGGLNLKKIPVAEGIMQTNLLAFLELMLTTILSQILTISLFAASLVGLRPDIDFLKAATASGVVSFVASLPISINGWGVRELTAVSVYGLLGVAHDSALAVSVLVGAFSTLILLAFIPFVASRSAGERDGAMEATENGASSQRRSLSGERVGAWIIIASAGALIFIQLHVDLPGGEIALNLADPFAILALGAMIAQAFYVGAWPRWRLSKLNGAFLIIFSLILIGFIRGSFVIGVTQWAFLGRVLGWPVLIGYLAVGYLTLTYTGSRGRRYLVQWMLATAAAIILFEFFSRWLTKSGGILLGNFDGFSGNKNAFALQLVVCSVLFLSYCPIFERKRRHLIIGSLFHGVIIAGIFFSASRTGLIVEATILLLCLIFRWSSAKTISLSMVVVTVLWGLSYFRFDYLVHLFYDDSPPPGVAVSFIQRYVSPQSNTERLKTIYQGLAMFLSHPILGGGLGVFIEQSKSWNDNKVVIHNTPIWILAEFGLMGAAVFGYLFYNVYKDLDAIKKCRVCYRMFVLLAVAIAMTGMAQEIFYQRILYLGLGLALALGSPKRPFRERASCSELGHSDGAFGQASAAAGESGDIAQWTAARGLPQ